MAGKKKNIKHSPIIDAIAAAESGTTGEIRVHLSKQWLERDIYKHAWKIFERYGMNRTAQRNAVLIYVNLRKRQFAIIGDEGIQAIVGQPYWEKLAAEFKKHLRSTYVENAIAAAVLEVGVVLKKWFPLESGARNPNELRDEVTVD